jgi:hypothetical protein
VSDLSELLIPFIKDQMLRIEKQNYILLAAADDAMSTADEIMILLKKNDVKEAILKVEYLRKNTLNAKTAVVSLDKPSMR